MTKHKIHWLIERPDRWGAWVFCGKWLDRWDPRSIEEQTASRLIGGDLKQVTCEKCLKLMMESGMKV